MDLSVDDHDHEIFNRWLDEVEKKRRALASFKIFLQTGADYYVDVVDQHRIAKTIYGSYDPSKGYGNFAWAIHCKGHFYIKMDKTIRCRRHELPAFEHDWWLDIIPKVETSFRKATFRFLCFAPVL